MPNHRPLHRTQPSVMHHCYRAVTEAHAATAAESVPVAQSRPVTAVLPAQATLNLSDEQKQRLLDARRALIKRVESIISERR